MTTCLTNRKGGSCGMHVHVHEFALMQVRGGPALSPKPIKDSLFLLRSDNRIMCIL